MTRALLDRAAHVARWVVLASFVGAVAGVLSAAFIETLDWTTRTRGGSGWLVWLLPVAGLAVGSAYHYLGRGLERGSNLIIEQIHVHSRWIPVRMSVLIFVCSAVSHLCGASVGREGAALQLAAGVTDPVSRRLGLDQRDRAVMLVAAIAGGFGSVVGVPVTGAVFALEVQRTGRVDHEAIVPAFTASIVGTAVVRMIGVTRPGYASFPEFDWTSGMTWRIGLLGLACGLVAACYVTLTGLVRDTLARAVKWPPARPMIGGALLLAIFLLGDWSDYQGLSLHLASQAFDGSVVGVPVTGAVFALEVQRTGRVDHEAIVPAFTASIVGTAVVRMIGVTRPGYASFPEFDWTSGMTWRIGLLGLACGLVAACYVTLTGLVRDTLARAVKWPPARPMIGGALLLAIFLLGDWSDYQGLSLHLASQAFDGSVAGQWPVKILLTSLSIGAGFVGGEVIPLFVTGALLGASTGQVLGGDPALFAMVGAVTMVSAALNTPVAGVFLGIELFGGPGVVLLAVACVMGYVGSGQVGIYSSQPVAAHKSGRRD